MGAGNALKASAQIVLGDAMLELVAQAPFYQMQPPCASSARPRADVLI